MGTPDGGVLTGSSDGGALTGELRRGALTGLSGERWWQPKSCSPKRDMSDHPRE